ncbi:FAD-dependent oxidoreductase [Actinomycetospora straminea]|uniref:FAD-dependent oxidoreductase n=2 Tax=Actinomycetospora straminea TaxID=663607 RepID=A0ABP9F0G4_9PSEU
MQVLVVGAGYAGATAAVRLAGRAAGRVDVTVVNPRPGFVNRLRLHHVAVGQRVAAPALATMLGAGVWFVEGQVTDLGLDTGRAVVAGPGGPRTVRYDRLVLATGSTTEVPVPGGEHAHAVGDIGAARRLRHALDGVAAGADVAVVGGGFTGLETVGELAEHRPDLRVRLVTAGEVGGWFPPRGAAHVRRTLATLGVEAVGGRRVAAVEPDRVLLDDGDALPAALMVWCGGFVAPSLAWNAGLAVDERGAVLTDTRLRSVTHDHVLAVGDAGHAPAPGGGRYSMSCQYAFPSAAHAADLLVAEALGTPDTRPLDLGFTARVVSLGRHHAVLQPTDRRDTARGRAITGRAALATKWFQVRGTVSAIGLERRFPGVVHWPHADAGDHADAGAVTPAVAAGSAS